MLAAAAGVSDVMIAGRGVARTCQGLPVAYHPDPYRPRPSALDITRVPGPQFITSFLLLLTRPPPPDTMVNTKSLGLVLALAVFCAALAQVKPEFNLNQLQIIKKNYTPTY